MTANLKLLLKWPYRREAIWMWVAWHMPRALVYWCAVRLMTHATTGRWGRDVTPSVTCLTALERWHD